MAQELLGFACWRLRQQADSREDNHTTDKTPYTGPPPKWLRARHLEDEDHGGTDKGLMTLVIVIEALTIAAVAYLIASMG